MLRSWQAAETHPHTYPLVRAPASASAGRPDALALMEPLPPLEPVPSWRASGADRRRGVSSANALAAVRAAPLHSKVGALVQLLRFSGGADGCGMPPLPPAEQALLVAAESYADVQTSRTWAQVRAEMGAEGWEPTAADRTRQIATVRAGGARVDGVWAAQGQIHQAGAASEATLEALHYQHLAHARDANPMRILRRPTGGKRSLEQRRRGQLAMRQMLERSKTPWVADKGALREQVATQALLEEPSRLITKAEAWLVEGSVGNLHAAATKLQAAQRSKKAREDLEKKKKADAEKNGGGGKGGRGKARPRTAHT